MPHRLLIVEDHAAMRRLIINMVQDMATEVVECSDGGKAFSAYSACRPDWVFMDIKLPDVDGITATRRITQAWPEARVVIVTERNEAGMREAAQRAGACGYVLKENLSEIRRILGNG
ncbi:MAG: response regulator transcription factor [Acidobacteria bacterium]|nr:response regulator transcription factor [Acidobacteriota bacterium]MCW5969909.1 response regulator transcription factor [Blastocatellales bacterium]